MPKYIYKGTNQVTGMQYVGATNNFERRTHEHEIADTSSYLHAAVREYGSSNFVYEILEECDDACWKERERFWIENLGTLHPNGYNVSKGGNTHIYTDEWRHKQSKANRNRSNNISVNDIPVIFDLYIKGAPLKDIGERYSVSDQMIREVINRKHWTYREYLETINNRG